MASLTLRRTTIATITAAFAVTLTVGAVAPSASAGRPQASSTTGTGAVFIANPVQSTGDQSLTDQKDSATAVPAGAYYSVTLHDLDGSGFLTGQWANIRSETGDPAFSATNTFVFDRHDDQFEQVMAYFWITEAQRYLRLGFRPRAAPRSTPSRRTCGSTSGARTTRSPGTRRT